MSSESRPINPPSFYEKDKEDDLIIRCEMCLDFVHIFDTKRFYQHEFVCRECIDLNLNKYNL